MNFETFCKSFGKTYEVGNSQEQENCLKNWSFNSKRSREQIEQLESLLNENDKLREQLNVSQKQLDGTERDLSFALQLLKVGHRNNNEYIDCLEIQKEELLDEIESYERSSMTQIILGLILLMAIVYICKFV
jgi:hypothetical protein